VSDQDDRETLATNIPPETKEILEEQDGYLWEAVTEAVHNTYGGERLETPEAVRREIEIQERNRRDKIERKNELETEIERHEQRVDSLKEKLAEMQDTDDERVDELDEILDLMLNEGARFWDDHPKVVDLARRYYGGKYDADMVISDLRERAEERDLEIPEDQFEPKYGGK